MRISSTVSPTTVAIDVYRRIRQRMWSRLFFLSLDPGFALSSRTCADDRRFRILGRSLSCNNSNFRREDTMDISFVTLSGWRQDRLFIFEESRNSTDFLHWSWRTHILNKLDRTTVSKPRSRVMPESGRTEVSTCDLGSGRCVLEGGGGIECKPRDHDTVFSSISRPEIQRSRCDLHCRPQRRPNTIRVWNTVGPSDVVGRCVFLPVLAHVLEAFSVRDEPTITIGVS